MQPIETKYKGYRFRSRLEARWAVFLDYLNADWTYESEGFILQGTWYLPDFYVADWSCWIEIKPSAPSDAEIAKAQLLAESSGKRVLLIAGDPWVDQQHKTSYRITYFAADGTHRSGTDRWEFGQGRRCEDEIWLLSDDYGAFPLRPIPHERDDKYPLGGSYASNIVAALSAARGARFEHGESG